MAYDLLLFRKTGKEMGKICTVKTFKTALKCIHNWNEKANDEDGSSNFYIDMVKIDNEERKPFKISLSNLFYDSVSQCSFLVDTTEEMIHVLNGIRLSKGKIDLVNDYLNNPTYYSFYLFCDLENKEFKLEATSSKPVGQSSCLKRWYKIPLNDLDKKEALSATNRELFNCISNEEDKWKCIKAATNFF